MDLRLAKRLADRVEHPLREPVAGPPLRGADPHGLVEKLRRGVEVRLKAIDAPKRPRPERPVLLVDQKALPKEL